ncbi:MAG: anti-sigma factor family protein [Woeseiaceae bacterium]
MNDRKNNDAMRKEPHVGELLSGYVDGELTQQDAQRVRLHIDQCASCEHELEEIELMRSKMGNARLSNADNDIWRETMDDASVKATRGIGWLLVVGGALVAGGFGVYEVLTNFASWGLAEKLIVGGLYGGGLLLFLSVLRQRLIERKKDRYKDVEI